MLRAAEQAGAAIAGEGRIGRDKCLAQIDGIHGEDPSQGLVRGRTFVHPDLRFAFDVPQGYRMLNMPAAVIGQAQGSLMKFDAARVPEDRDLGAYVACDWAQELGAEGIGNVAQSQVNGMRVASAVAPGQLEEGVRSPLRLRQCALATSRCTASCS